MTNDLERRRVWFVYVDFDRRGNRKSVRAYSGGTRDDEYWTKQDGPVTIEPDMVLHKWTHDEADDDNDRCVLCDEVRWKEAGYLLVQDATQGWYLNREASDYKVLIDGVAKERRKFLRYGRVGESPQTKAWTRTALYDESGYELARR